MAFYVRLRLKALTWQEISTCMSQIWDDRMTYGFKFTEPKATVCLGRTWSSFRANMVTTTVGRFVANRAADTSLMFHLGAPAKVHCDYDGITASRVQSRGKFDIIPIGTLASWEDEDPTFSLNIWLSQTLVASVARDMKPAGGRVSLDPRISQEDTRLFAAAQLIKFELESDAPDDLFAESLAAAMTVRMLARYGLSDRSRPTGLTRRQLKTVVDYLHSNLDGDTRLATLAALIDRSESHFRALFRETVGRPVHQYVMDLRLQRARDLLQAGERSIAQAAIASGFCHQSHLAKAMRQRWQVTPSEFIRQVRNPSANPADTGATPT